MAEENKTKVEKEAKETKKLEEFKETEENKEAVAKSEGKVEIKKEESKPAVTKTSKKAKTEEKVELEREYVVPLKKGVLNVPHYRRAKKAIRVLKEFIVQHMKVRDRDLRKVKIDIHLNNELWFRGIKKPANKIKVKAKKIGEIVYVELAEIPETRKFIMAREARKKAEFEAAKIKKPKKSKEKAEKDSDKDGVSDKIEEKEDIKAVIEKSAEIGKANAKTEKHTIKGPHAKKTMPVKGNPKK
ncbi:MAG: 50S ribosomal protein L31e [Nanoarchaeota archaeon]|nr:50S ribosomal protein L31e [Nanoarchaeota archaeon]